MWLNEAMQTRTNCIKNTPAVSECTVWQNCLNVLCETHLKSKTISNCCLRHFWVVFLRASYCLLLNRRLHTAVCGLVLISAGAVEPLAKCSSLKLEGCKICQVGSQRSKRQDKWGEGNDSCREKKLFIYDNHRKKQQSNSEPVFLNKWCNPSSWPNITKYANSFHFIAVASASVSGI